MRKKGKPALIVDFELVPPLSSSPVFMSIDAAIEKEVERFPEFAERLDVCTKFAWFADAGEETLCVQENRVLRMREAFLRAALAEFAELDAAIVRDTRKAKLPLPPRLRDTQRPLLHILRALRNVAIHLEPGRLRPEQREVVLRWRGEEDRHRVVTVWLVSRATVSSLQDPCRMHDYRPSDRIQMADWLSGAQEKFGVFELVRVGAEEYARIIASTFR